MVKLIFLISSVFVVTIMLVTVARSQVSPDKRRLIRNEMDGVPSLLQKEKSSIKGALQSRGYPTKKAGKSLVVSLSSTLPPEVVSGEPATAELLTKRSLSPAKVVALGSFTSVQVNLDHLGNNVVNDAANEPSIAIDPTDANKMAIGWRQFDTIFDLDAFRQAGIAYSQDGGQTWTSPVPNILDPGQFRSDPVLTFDSNGNFFYSSLSALDSIEVFKSVDGGVSWSAPVPAFGGDKQWFTADRTTGIGSGNLYQIWNVQFSCCPPNDFTRSTNSSLSFDTPVAIPQPSMKWGTMDVGPDGTLYLAGADLNTSLGHIFAKSTNAQDSNVSPTFDLVVGVDLGGRTAGGGINPAGLLGQVWIATDHSNGPTHGNIYIAGSIFDPILDVLDIRFIRSVDGGQSWSSPGYVNDDPASGVWHWFGTMSVAPNGRIDVIWNDTRNDPGNFLSQVFYSFSNDGGVTWSANIAVSPSFDPSLGYPAQGDPFQDKIGDYYHMISNNGGASLAYAATFNGEEDVYFLRIPRDCNSNTIEDDCDIACGPAGSRCDVPGCGDSADCNFNDIPDECEPDQDCQPNGVRDICDIGAGTSNDCNGNNVPDDCESSADCQLNSTIDICDIALGTSKDCNENGVPDECDIVGITSTDVNDDAVPDECQGACCQVCGDCFETTPVDCAIHDGIFNGFGVSCVDANCAPPSFFANDDCLQKELLPGFMQQTVPIDNRCATLDGPPTVDCDNGPQPFGADLWFSYVPPCSGEMTVSLCDNTFFDAIMGIYGGGPDCECPNDNSSLIACGDDTCGMGGGPPTLTLQVEYGMCYTIRVAGWSGSKGTGEMNISVAGCTPECGGILGDLAGGPEVALDDFAALVCVNPSCPDTISLVTTLDALAGHESFAVFVDVVDFDVTPLPIDQTGAVTITIPDVPTPTLLDTIVDPVDAALPSYIDVVNVDLALVSSTEIRVSFQTRGVILPEGDSRINALFYRAWIDLDEPFMTGVDYDDPEFNWIIGGSSVFTYFTSGPGVSTNVEISCTNPKCTLPCISGPGTPVAPGCNRLADTDCDGDIDLRDLAKFLNEFTGWP